MHTSWKCVTRSRRRLVPVLAAVVLAATACGSGASGSGGSGGSGVPSTVTIAYQPGISYAPLIVIRQDNLLHKKFPNLKVNWKKLSSGAPIRNGIISGDIQVGAGGVGPLLIGWAKGVGWKYLAPMNTMPLWLMTTNPEIHSVKDLKPGQRIAMPSPTSIQSVVLRKAAAKYLGNPHALDSDIVAMGHPKGLQALLSHQIDAHLTSPPFEFIEKQKGARRIVNSYDLFGTHTFNGVLMTEDYYKSHQKFANGLYQLVVQANKEINTNPGKAAQALAKASAGKRTAAEFKTYLENPSLKYTVQPQGLMKFGKFMHQIGMIDKAPRSVNDLLLPPAQKGAK